MNLSLSDYNDIIINFKIAHLIKLNTQKFTNNVSYINPSLFICSMPKLIPAVEENDVFFSLEYNHKVKKKKEVENINYLIAQKLNYLRVPWNNKYLLTLNVTS